ncbi:hypothetical protein WN55_10556 [Dufourea novaeangliae]|uniref:MADF domain-containing protein n=1 Tax=Dufourea novaeangliae TaxID=178035 RepID=A0A154P3X7_DUFNO|nr:hypothetical protein WN55_10556 [Dufourea novaeangliae]
MPKTGRTMKQSQYGINDTLLIEFVKSNPVMYEPILKPEYVLIVDGLWENVANLLNAPVDLVKKRWLNIKDSYSRRKSLRSAYNLDFLPLSSLDLSNDNSCASSKCSSPKEDETRSTRSVRSVSQLSSSSQTDTVNWSVVSTNAPESKQIGGKSRSRMSTPSQKNSGSINETQSVESNVRRFQDISAMTDCMFLPSEENHEKESSTPARWLSESPESKIEAKKQHAADSTRAFFESMAMTVSTFPQHIQASLKVRICNLVGDAEYGLTIPKPF